MKSQLCRGTVWHSRRDPTPHRFSYPSLFFVFNLAELSSGLRIPGFSHNQRNLFSIRDTDYLRRGNQPLLTKLTRELEPHGIVPDPSRTLFVTTPRTWGHVFNPVSFYVGLTSQHTPTWLAAEVNNTCRDRHLYVLPRLNPEPAGNFTASCPKVFHVSPFNDREGIYFFRIQLTQSSIDLGVRLSANNQERMDAGWQGPLTPLQHVSLPVLAVTHPFNVALTFPRILAQAARLYFLKKLPFHTRPQPNTPGTLRTRED